MVTLLFTLKPKSGATEAVTLPLNKIFDVKASGANAALGILNNPSPLPLKYPLPDGITILPLTSTLPVN